MYHYLRGPALGWAAMLKMTKVALELIRDPKMCILFEKDTRDGVSYIPNRYSKVSNKYLKSYDSKQELKHIYLIANNLCDYAMSKFLPTNGFKQIDPKEFDFNKYTSNSSKGCVLEVDLKYPKELRELHSYYPLPSDKTEIKREMLSDYQLKIADLYNTSTAISKRQCLTFSIKKNM